MNFGEMCERDYGKPRISASAEDWTIQVRAKSPLEPSWLPFTYPCWPKKTSEFVICIHNME